MTETNKEMATYDSYIAGWLDSSIHDFMEVFPATYKSMEYALITCLDSNSDLVSLLDSSPEFKILMAKARPVGRGLLMATETLLEIDSYDQVFFGIDEVWFFPSDNIEPKPESGCLVGPGRVDQNTMNHLGKWMEDTSCTLALGDGDGLNLIVKAKGLIRHIIGHSNNQPIPTLQTDFLFEEENVGGSQVRKT